MGRLSDKLRNGEDGRLLFMCPGCRDWHCVKTGSGQGPRWGWNGNVDKPTFTPSVLVTWSEPSDVPEEFDDESKDKQMICHSYVTDGRIWFLGDSTHSLVGQTVDLMDLPTNA